MSKKIITNGKKDRCYKLCRCSECGKESICTPQDDYYTLAGNHEGGLLCESCFNSHLYKNKIKKS